MCNEPSKPGSTSPTSADTCELVGHLFSVHYWSLETGVSAARPV